MSKFEQRFREEFCHEAWKDNWVVNEFTDAKDIESFILRELKQVSSDSYELGSSDEFNGYCIDAVEDNGALRISYDNKLRWYHLIESRSVYVHRDVGSNVIDDFMILPSHKPVDEDRTGFYFEAEFNEVGEGGTEKLLKQLKKQLIKFLNQ